MDKQKSVSASPKGVVFSNPNPTDWVAKRLMGGSGESLTPTDSERISKVETLVDNMYEALFGEDENGEDDGLISLIHAVESKVDALDDDSLHRRIAKLQGQLGVLATWMEKYTPYLNGLEMAFERDQAALHQEEDNSYPEGAEEWIEENIKSSGDGDE